MAGRKLNGYVVLHVDGLPTQFGPDDDVPAHLVDLIGDHLWESGAEPEAKQEPAKQDGAGDGSSEPVIPPQGGPGSGKTVWLAYAKAKGVDIDAAATRDEIVTALAAAGVPTE